MHTQPVPRLGGVAVAAALLISLLVGAGAAGNLFGVPVQDFSLLVATLAAAGLLLGVGLIDDFRDLRPALKLAAQGLAAALLFFAGFRVDSISLLAGSSVQFGATLSLVLTILWIVGVTNAFNLIDGLDGLATGIALVALLATVAAAGALGNLGVLFAAVALMGALFGFLRYNFSPATIFLGDSGSLSIGLLLSVLVVEGARQPDSSVLIVLPLFALALPILDTGLAIVRRWLRGVPLSGADARHIHHRFIALGYSHRRTAMIMYVIAGLLAALGLSLAFAPPAALLVLVWFGVASLVGLLIVGLHCLDYHEFRVALSFVVTAPWSGRRAIRSLIHAHDVAAVVTRATSVAQLEAILEDSAGDFGFLGMEICSERSECSGVLSRLNGQAARAWKLDFPVHGRFSAEDDPLVLRIWCPLQRGSATLQAERVAHLLALPIEGALVRLASPDSVADSIPLIGLEATAARSDRAHGLVAPLGQGLSALPEPRAARPSLLRRVAGAAR